VNIHTISMGPVEANCYIVSSNEDNIGFVIDPGSVDISKIKTIIEDEQLQIKAILLTHGHFDHILGVDELRKLTGAKLYIHEADKSKLIEPNDNLSKYMGAGYYFEPADELLHDGDTIEIGDLHIKVLHTPGHTPGGVCYYVNNCIFTGDTLFAGSIGRTDFPNGSQKDLMVSIQNKLLCLPDETIVYPGHNRKSTIIAEKNNNPYLKNIDANFND